VILIQSQKGTIDTRQQPYNNLLCRSRNTEARLIPTTHESFLRQNPRLDQELNTLDLLLMWHTTTGNIFGQCNIHNIHVLPRSQIPAPMIPRSLSAQQQQLQHKVWQQQQADQQQQDSQQTAAPPIPLRFIINSVSKIVHDFEQNRYHGRQAQESDSKSAPLIMR
jgi:hypothetical protein